MTDQDLMKRLTIMIVIVILMVSAMSFASQDNKPTWDMTCITPNQLTTTMEVSKNGETTWFVSCHPWNELRR